MNIDIDVYLMPEGIQQMQFGNCTECYQAGPLTYLCSKCWRSENVKIMEVCSQKRKQITRDSTNPYYITYTTTHSHRLWNPLALAMFFGKGFDNHPILKEDVCVLGNSIVVLKPKEKRTITALPLVTLKCLPNVYSPNLENKLKQDKKLMREINHSF